MLGDGRSLLGILGLVVLTAATLFLLHHLLSLHHKRSAQKEEEELWQAIRGVLSSPGADAKEEDA